MEAEATFTVQQVVATAFMLYLCMFHPVEKESGQAPGCVGHCDIKC